MKRRRMKRHTLTTADLWSLWACGAYMGFMLCLMLNLIFLR